MFSPDNETVNVFTSDIPGHQYLELNFSVFAFSLFSNLSYYEESTKFQILSNFRHIFHKNFQQILLKRFFFLPFFVIIKIAELSVFKCIEVFCNKRAKYFKAYFIANNSLQVYDSKHSFVIRFLWQVCVPESFSKIAHVAQPLASKKMTVLGKS